MGRIVIPEGFTGVIPPKEKGEHYTYCVDGERVPSVTGILSNNCGWGNAGLQWWAWDLGRQGRDYRKEMKAAGHAGTLAHKRVEHALAGKRPPSTRGFDKEAVSLSLSSFEAFLEWKEHFNFKPISMELSLVSLKYRYGGTFDIKNSMISTVQNKLALVDIKTSKDIYMKFWLQNRGYGQLIEENDGEKIEAYYILRIGRDGSFDYAFKPKAFMDECLPQFLGFVRNEHFIRKWGKK